MVTSLASTSIFMTAPLSSRGYQEEEVGQNHAQKHAEKPSQYTAEDIGQGIQPATISHELEGLPLERGERGVAPAESRADEQIQVLMRRRQTLEDQHGRGA